MQGSHRHPAGYRPADECTSSACKGPGSSSKSVSILPSADAKCGFIAVCLEPCPLLWHKGASLYSSLTCRKEERRAQLAKAAEDMKNTGKAEAAFEDSGYSVGEGRLADICICFLCK